ncbi:MAG: DNA primase [Clostridia bacterium]|nr:DNA primase [Clostridia bacterium]
MALPDDFLYELKTRNPIDETVSRYISLKKRGKNLIGLCPFHGEKTPSFTLYPENGSFYCFGCGKGGDVISFTMAIENLDYMESVKLLADRAGIRLPEQGYDDSAHRLRKTIYEINREAARFFNSYLNSPEGKIGYEYIKGRRITDATIKRFGLGYAPAEWDKLTKRLRSLGFNYEDMVTAGVTLKTKSGSFVDRFRNRMVFPLVDLRGNVLAFSCRKIDPEDYGGKYVNTNDTPVYKKSHNVFALNLAKNSGEDYFILCEGSMDVVMLQQAGFKNAVAAWGTAFTPEQAHLLKKYTDKIVLTLDADEAGQKATDRAISILNAEGMDVKVIRIPNGKDPDEFIKHYGKDGYDRFKALIEGAGNDVEYRLFKAMQNKDLTTAEGKAEFLSKAAEVLAQLSSPIERDIYASKLSEMYEVSKDAIMREINRGVRSASKERNQKQVRKLTEMPTVDRINPERTKNTRAANAEEGLLAVLIKNPDLIPFANQHLSTDSFITSFNRRVYEVISELHADNRPIDLVLLGTVFNSEELGRIVSVTVREDARANSKEECLTCINVIKEENSKSSLNGEETDDGDLAEYFKKLAEQKK